MSGDAEAFAEHEGPGPEEEGRGQGQEGPGQGQESPRWPDTARGLDGVRTKKIDPTLRQKEYPFRIVLNLFSLKICNRFFMKAKQTF